MLHVVTVAVVHVLSIAIGELCEADFTTTGFLLELLEEFIFSTLGACVSV